MKHARILLNGELVTAALPDLIVTVTGAMRYVIHYTPHAGRLQPARTALPRAGKGGVAESCGVA
jgi:hypothetical protein